MNGAVRGDVRHVAIFASLYALVGCGGGGGGSSPAGTATPNPSLGGVGIAISVPTAAPILANPTSLTFAHAGTTQTATLSQAGYGGSFTPTTSSASVATGSVARNSLGDYILTVTAAGPGSATIGIASDDGGKGSLPVTVTAP